MRTEVREDVVSLSKSSLLELAPTRAFRYFEAGSVIACTALALWLLREVMQGVSVDAPSWLWLVAAVVAAYVLADLIAGVVHFVGDSFGSVDTPWLGLTFVLPFRAHHVHPQDICRHDFVATNGNNAFATLWLLVPTLAWVPVDAGGVYSVLGAFVCSLAVWLMLTNQIHKWAHVDQAPRPVQWLQRWGVLLSPERHLAHHTPPYVGGYCVTSGLCNRLLDPVGFFPALERGVRGVLRLPPRKLT